MNSTKTAKIYNLKLTHSDFPFNRNFKSETSAKNWLIRTFGSEYFENNFIQTSKNSKYFQAPITKVWNLLKTHKTLIFSDHNSWEEFLTLTIR